MSRRRFLLLSPLRRSLLALVVLALGVLTGRAESPFPTDPLHVARGTLWSYTTDQFPVASTIAIHAAIENTGETPAAVTADVTVIDPDGLPIAQTRVPLDLAPRGRTPFHTKLAVPHPRPWKPENPRRYRVVVRLFQGRRLADRIETIVGLRTVGWSAERGLLLNEQPVALRGAALQGATSLNGTDAAYVDHLVEHLKAAGFNAIEGRLDENADGLFAACDRAGLLVVARISGGQDANEAVTQIQPARTHPSVLLWKIEERDSATANALAQAIKRADPSRPILSRDEASALPPFATVTVSSDGRIAVAPGDASVTRTRSSR
ncbi:MAG TPA: hypothetical protein VHF69_14960 [Candidatus Synoicihabitans sp.]|nr:hypothetical protein [Candidatus Synoicihabitans sp.]